MAQQNLRARQQQRRKIILILMLVLLLVAGIFYYIFSGQQKREPANVQRPLGKVAVPVLTRDAPLGLRIASPMIRVKFMYPNEVPPDAILNVDEFLGRFVTHPLLVGDYIRAGDVSEAGAKGGYSGIAQPGKRLVVLNSGIFPGSVGSLRIGDRVDILAIGDANAGVAGGGNAQNNALARRLNSPNTIEGGGAFPGDPNSASRRRNRNVGTGALTSLTATLIAENAEVMRTPGRGRDNELLVLQMEPQDAHVTTLMAAAGATMRVVFRPFNDDTRLTQDSEPKITTRLPKPTADPDAVTIIAGNVRRLQRPNSELFVPEEGNLNQVPVDEPVNPTFSDTRERSPR